MRRSKVISVIALIAGLAVYLNNSSYLASPPADRPSLLAHRGLHQTYDRTGITSETCTASRIDPPTHPFLENTISSIQAAFDLGADVVELDVHPTKDGHFVVFHDWTLDCRTDGHGVTREHTLAELKALDIGYGYTPDDGKTYPFRGRGIGLMPTLSEVLTAFPERTLLINVKSNDAQEGAQLADMLAQLPNERLERIMVYGGDAPIQVLRQRLPPLRTMSRQTLKSCFLRYAALGWSGYVPHPCRNTLLLVPTNIGPWLWGWPHVFQRRLARYNTVIYAVAPYDGGELSSGINSPDQLSLLPKDYVGGIWTDRIDIIGMLLAN